MTARSGFSSFTWRCYVALIVALGVLSVPQGSQVQAAPLASRLNCSGYQAGMYVLANDVLRYVNVASILTRAQSDERAIGLTSELATVLKTNSKPADNKKVHDQIVTAIGNTRAAVDAAPAMPRSANDQTALLNKLNAQRVFYGNVQILLREICLPSVIKHLPCSGKCVIDLVGTGRVRPWKDPKRGSIVTFVAPADYILRYSWDCSAAFDKTLGFAFRDFADGFTSTDTLTEQFGPTAKGDYSAYVDTSNPNRVFLYMVAEQACQWHITVTSG
jgi:hypothetical protein